VAKTREELMAQYAETAESGTMRRVPAGIEYNSVRDGHKRLITLEGDHSADGEFTSDAAATIIAEGSDGNHVTINRQGASGDVTFHVEGNNNHITLENAVPEAYNYVGLKGDRNTFTGTDAMEVVDISGSGNRVTLNGGNDMAAVEVQTARNNFVDGGSGNRDAISLNDDSHRVTGYRFTKNAAGQMVVSDNQGNNLVTAKDVEFVNIGGSHIRVADVMSALNIDAAVNITVASDGAVSAPPDIRVTSGMANLR